MDHVAPAPRPRGVPPRYAVRAARRWAARHDRNHDPSPHDSRRRYASALHRHHCAAHRRARRSPDSSPGVRRHGHLAAHQHGPAGHLPNDFPMRTHRGVGVGNGRRTWAPMLRPSTPRTVPKTTKSATLVGGALRAYKSGGVLLSQGISPQVPSALRGLTSVFGMGTGVTLSPWPPETCCQLGCTQRTPEQARAIV